MKKQVEDQTSSESILYTNTLGEEKDKLNVENGSLRVAKQDLIGLPMSGLRPKRSAKAPKKLSEHKEEQYLLIAIHIESKFSWWCMRDVAELKQFFIKQTCN